jgi:hypothetical protein
MKLEIVKESKFAEEKPWYILYADGNYLRGSHNLTAIEELYEEAKKYKGNITETIKEILKSEEI